MKNFKLKDHSIVEMDYKNAGTRNTGESKMETSGRLLIPKEIEGVIFEQAFEFNAPENSLHLHVVTRTLYEYVGEGKMDIKAANEECYEDAAKKLKESLMQVSELLKLTILEQIDIVPLN